MTFFIPVWWWGFGAGLVSGMVLMVVVFVGLLWRIRGKANARRAELKKQFLAEGMSLGQERAARRQE